jgi:ribosomal protein S8
MGVARVADLVARIKNGYRANLRQVIVPNSKMNRGILQQLFKEGFIAEYRLNLPSMHFAHSSATAVWEQSPFV